jgi:hypothetical protein
VVPTRAHTCSDRRPHPCTSSPTHPLAPGATPLHRLHGAQVCGRDRVGEIAALEARVNDLQDQVDEADEAQAAALELDDQLHVVRGALATAEARRAAAVAMLAAKKAELESIQGGDSGDDDDGGGAPDNEGAGDERDRDRLNKAKNSNDIDSESAARMAARVEEDNATLARLSQERDSVQRILDARQAEKDELEERVERGRARAAELRASLDALSGGDHDTDSGGEEDDHQPLTGVAANSANAHDATQKADEGFAVVTAAQGVPDKDLVQLHRVLTMMLHIKEAKLNSARQADRVHALRSELNRAKLNIAMASPRGATSAGAESSLSYGGSPRAVAASPHDPAAMNELRDRTQSISWKPPPKPPPPRGGPSRRSFK